jgi:hypothetical protein
MSGLCTECNYDDKDSTDIKEKINNVRIAPSIATRETFDEVKKLLGPFASYA